MFQMSIFIKLNNFDSICATLIRNSACKEAGYPMALFNFPILGFPFAADIPDKQTTGMKTAS